MKTLTELLKEKEEKEYNEFRIRVKESLEERVLTAKTCEDKFNYIQYFKSISDKQINDLCYELNKAGYITIKEKTNFTDVGALYIKW